MGIGSTVALTWFIALAYKSTYVRSVPSFLHTHTESVVEVAMILARRVSCQLLSMPRIVYPRGVDVYATSKVSATLHCSKYVSAQSY